MSLTGTPNRRAVNLQDFYAWRHLRSPQRFVLCLLCLACVSSDRSVIAQVTITSIQPRTCLPGETTLLTIAGKDLAPGFRLATSIPDNKIEVVSVEAQKATVKLTVPKHAPMGPLGLWIATEKGLAEPSILLIDDLPVIAENNNNNTPETAQEIARLVSVEGKSDGAKSDYFRVKVEAGERLAFQVLTQALESTMDPVVRLLNRDGRVLFTADDDLTGPDCRFSFKFVEANEYLIQIHDNRFVAGGAYQLRVGDFPLIDHAVPLAVQKGIPTEVGFTGTDAVTAQSVKVDLPLGNSRHSHTVSARFPDGKSSLWTMLRASEQPVSLETAVEPPASVLEIPVTISGQLLKPKEQDRFSLKGTKGQKVRFGAATRSLGCATLLKMELSNPAGAKVAETSVTALDEWSLDYTFPEDGAYQLVVSDLLERGGDPFGYLIDVSPARGFSLALKADAKLAEQFAMEPQHGACAVDLLIDRLGYEGELELSFDGEAAGLSIMNPIIPAKAKEAKIYLTATPQWQPEALALVGFLAKAKDDPTQTARLSSLAYHRIKRPHVPFPHRWNDGQILLGGVPATEPGFTFSPTAPLQFARPLKSQGAKLQLKRSNEAFKGPVVILPDAPQGDWQVTAKADKDVYDLTLAPRKGPDELPALTFATYSEFNGRGRVEKFAFPIEWIDPLQVSFAMPEQLVAGKAYPVRVALSRAGNDPQPVSVTVKDLPVGITAPVSLNFKADEQATEWMLQVAPDYAAPEGTVSFVATSKFQGNDFSVEGTIKLPQAVPLPARLAIHPTEIDLNNKKERRQLVITGFDAAGMPRDWTHDATVSVANPAIATVVDAVVRPVADGETEIVVQVGSLRQSISVRVANTGVATKTAFESEVLVALSKQGCNSGACHGSPSGKGMFRLSLRAFDRQLDELTLIREEQGRRLNRIEPERSLLLLKPLMQISHGGGKQLRPEDEAYAILRDWIAEGAQGDPPDTPRCVRLAVYPENKRILHRKGGGQQFSVVAHFSDNSQRDVTHLVAYESSNTSVATVDGQGQVTPHGRGESAILVRFLEHIESVPLMFVEDVPNFRWPTPPTNNYVDELVHAKLQQLQFLPAETCNDSEFIRRIYLDVIGLLPTVEETKAFLADQSPDKRARLVDHLLERPEYAKFWALKWGDLLKMTSKGVGDAGVYKYHRWVETAIAENLPYDQFAKSLVTASGSTLAHPPANFYRTSTDMNECVETISQVFLGARLQCAKCHNHPFERWTQDNYYGLGAFFQRVQRRNTQRPGEMFIWTSATGEVSQPRTGQQMKPWLPVTGTIVDGDQGDRRNTFAEWLVSPENPFFARIEANRIWSQLFARGIVDPIDDFRDSNPPTNAPLLDALAKDFVDSGFDRKHLLRVILNSRTYQASYRTNEFNESDSLYASHQQPRLLSAEQLLDAVNHVTGLSQVIGSLPAGTKATQMPAPDLAKVDFLKVFGQPERSTVCACERTEDSNLGMAIELFNGATIHGKLRDPNNRFRKAIAAGNPAGEVIQELYLAAFCRNPTEAELQASLAHCQQREDLAAGIEDVCWALLNTDEFLFQH